MAEFSLIDLRTQMPFLPKLMQSWPRERLLSWLRVYGEVYEFADPLMQDTYLFRSWVGLGTGFIYREPGELFIPGTTISAWERSQPETRE